MALKKLILSIIVVSVILIIVVFLQSTSISPVAYLPSKPSELKGVLAPNNLLHKAELLGLGQINGPEEVAVDSQGRVYGGTQHGKIMIITADGKLDVFAETPWASLGHEI